MRRYWLVFSQAVTVLLAAYFVVGTLKPEWLARGGAAIGQGPLAVVEAPAPATVSGPPPPGSFREAAKRASAAVVSINTSKAPEQHPQA
ncbi:MAG TPA: 2-alkenal reductase, partial [Ramlibacter sp.]|nr:2-alkenal reductase [Ramlibacter sp.]